MITKDDSTRPTDRGLKTVMFVAETLLFVIFMEESIDINCKGISSKPSAQLKVESTIVRA